MNKEVDQFFENLENWKAEMQALRIIALQSGLSEAFKWKQACYTYQNRNVILIASLKEYCAISFFKGVLLSDPNKLLHKAGENSQIAHLLKFTSLEEITRKEKIITTYIFEAIEIEKAGQKVPKTQAEPLTPELIAELDDNTDLKTAFYALTPGKQRGYNLYFSQPKQAKTRISRIEKYKSKILAGKGFHDCTCGLSKKFPRCDGSHKHLKQT